MSALNVTRGSRAVFSRRDVLRFLLDFWLLATTLFMGLLSAENYGAYYLHFITPFISFVLGIPFLATLRRTRGEQRNLLLWFFLFIGCWFLAAASGIWNGYGLGIEWLDTPLMALPFMLIITRHGVFFAEWLRHRILILSAYFSVLLILYSLTGWSLPGYRPIVADIRSEGIHLYYPTFLWLSILLLWRECLTRFRLGVAALLTLVGTGVFLEGHTSMFAAAASGMLIIFISAGRSKRSMRFAGRQALLLLAVVGIASYLLYDTTGLSDERIASRAVHNEYRMSLAKDHPLLGVGLYHSDTTISREAVARSNSAFDLRIFTVDSGYIDLVLRFGLAGATFYVLIWIWLGIRFWAQARSKGRPGLLLPVIAGALVSSFTWSVFTWEHGLWVLFGALALDFQLLRTASMRTKHQNMHRDLFISSTSTSEFGGVKGRSY